jgi:acylphosphatase
MERRHLLISGDVQGVFFRSSTEDVAHDADVTGWVRNLPDGRVEAEVQGATDAIDRVVEHCRTGPTQARVDDIEETEIPLVEDEQGFEVR